MNTFTQRATLFTLAASIAVFAGCSQGPQVSQEELDTLKSEIETLKSENETLKTQLAMKDTQSLKAPALETNTAAKTFTDLDGELSTTPLIQDLARLGVFKAMGDEFKPYEPITRGEYVTWLFKAHNAIAKSPEKKIQLAPTYDPGFSDLDKSHPAYKYVASMASAGYSVGYDDKTFKPDQPITREEMIVIKVGVDKGKAFGPNASQMAYVWKFSDSKEVDRRYTGYIHADNYVSNSNISRAFGKIGTFKPKEPVLRHEAAATLWQFGDSANIRKTTAKYALERLAGDAG